MINQEFKAPPWKKISSAAEFWDLLQRARGAQNCEFSRIRAQFLLCPRRPVILQAFGQNLTLWLILKET